MRQVWISRPGDPGVLEARDAPDPRPGAGEALVAVRTIGVNFADIMARMGLYPEAPRGRFVPGYEIAGTVVEATGEPALAAGTRVLAITRFGGYSTMVSVPRDQLWPLPEDMDFETAAALPVSYLTASLALRRFARLQHGETVLIRSAAGGLGLAAIQLAHAAGARVLASAGAAKHARLRDTGVALTLDSRVDPRGAVREATGGRGVDVILNSTGGSTVRTDLELLAPLGRLVLCGISTAAPGARRSLPGLLGLLLGTPRPHPFGLMNRNIGVFGINLGKLWSEIHRMRGELEAVMELYRAGSVRPVVDRVFPLDRAADAHRYIQERRNFGKVLLVGDQAPGTALS